MISYFNEKSAQVEHVGLITSFGIQIESRYDKANEIVAMLNFTIKVADANLHTLVKSVFFDSKASICGFVFSDSLEQYSDEAMKIQACASSTIHHFVMFDHEECGLC